MKMIFNTPQGNVEDDFSPDQPLRVVKAEVLSRLRLPANWVDQYMVASEGNTLDESKSLSELSLPENAILTVWRVSSSSTGTARTWDRSGER